MEGAGKGWIKWQFLSLMLWFCGFAAFIELWPRLNMRSFSGFYNLFEAFVIALVSWVISVFMVKSGPWARLHQLVLLGVPLVPAVLFAKAAL